LLFSFALAALIQGYPVDIKDCREKVFYYDFKNGLNVKLPGKTAFVECMVNEFKRNRAHDEILKPEIAANPTKLTEVTQSYAMPATMGK